MTRKLFIIFVVLPMLFSSSVSQNNTIPHEVIAEWKLLEFGFSTQKDKDEAISSGNLVPRKAIPVDLAVSLKGDKIIITAPRFVTGVPYTLATVNPKGPNGPNGPILQPYPSYNWHNNYKSGICDGMVSAFRVTTTECNQMWVIDTGREGDTQYCPPQLLLFDLNTDKLIHRYQFDKSLYTPSVSFLTIPTAHVQDPSSNCKKTFVYVADVKMHGLVVYDYEQNLAWRVEDKWMYPDPNYGTLTVAGESIELMDGIFGLATDENNLYFHALSSLNEISVPLSYVNNRTNFVSGSTGQASAFTKLGSRSSECTVQAIDSYKNLYCVTLNPIKLLSWYTGSKEYSQRSYNEIPINQQWLEFVSGMKVVQQYGGSEYLWIMSDRFQKFFGRTLNKNEVNFRITRRLLEH